MATTRIKLKKIGQGEPILYTINNDDKGNFATFLANVGRDIGVENPSKLALSDGSVIRSANQLEKDDIVYVLKEGENVSGTLLFYSILFYSILFYSILFYSILFAFYN